MILFIARGTLVSEISESVSHLLNGGLQRLKEDLSGNLHLDISAELARYVTNNFFYTFLTINF